MDPLLSMSMHASMGSKVVGVVLVSAFGASCRCITANCHKQFTLYAEPIRQVTENTLRMDGVYVGDRDGTAYYFRRDGCIKEYPFLYAHVTTEAPRVVDSIFHEGRGYLTEERWGLYAIKGDSLLVQAFNFKPMTGCRRSVFDLRGRMDSDSTLTIFSEYWHYRDDYSAGFPQQFHFVPLDTALLPSLHRPWFERKKWYREARHSGRP